MATEHERTSLPWQKASSISALVQMGFQSLVLLLLQPPDEFLENSERILLITVYYGHLHAGKRIVADSQHHFIFLNYFL
jgi:hypothetical protein